MKPLSNCPPLLVVVLRLPGVQDEERRQQGLGKQPGRRGGQPAGPRGGRARTDGHQRRLHPQVRIASSPPHTQAPIHSFNCPQPLPVQERAVVAQGTSDCPRCTSTPARLSGTLLGGDVQVLLPDRTCNPFRNFHVCFLGASSHWAGLANLLKNGLPKTTLSNAGAVLTGSSLKIPIRSPRLSPAPWIKLPKHPDSKLDA